MFNWKILITGEKIRIKITSEIFEETCPVHPDGKELTKLDDLKDITNKVPYKLQVNFDMFIKKNFLDIIIIFILYVLRNNFL